MTATVLRDQVHEAARKSWWMPVLRGVLLVLLGLVVLCWPQASWVAFYWVAAAFFIVDGLIMVIGGIAGKGMPGRWWTVVAGVAAIALGIAAFVWPDITVTVIYALVTAWVLVAGIYAIVGALQLRKLPGSGWGWTLVMGILSILVGVMLIIWPIAGVVSLAIVVAAFVGVFAVVGGVLYIVTGAKIHSLAKH